MQQRRPNVGRASAFIEAGRAATLGGGQQVGNQPIHKVNFSTLTEDQYRETLIEQGASDHMIEKELEVLRQYKERIDTANVRKVREKLKAKREATARNDLAEYFEVSDRMKKRNRKEQEDGT